MRAERRLQLDGAPHFHSNGDTVATAAMDEPKQDQKVINKMLNKTMVYPKIQ